MILQSSDSVGFDVYEWPFKSFIEQVRRADRQQNREKEQRRATNYTLVVQYVACDRVHGQDDWHMNQIKTIRKGSEHRERT